MLNVHFVILGAACTFVGQGFYVRDTLRGTTHPNRVTWLLWGAAPMLAFAVEMQSGVGLRALMTFSVGFGPLVVVVASFANRHAVWRISRLDWVCGALSLAGTALWLGTRQGTIGIAAAIAADALAGVPTLRKSWRAPESESAGPYLGGLANAVITLLTLTTFTAAEVAFPLYVAVVEVVVFTLIAGRIGPRLRSLTGTTGGGVPQLPTSPDGGVPNDPSPTDTA